MTLCRAMKLTCAGILLLFLSGCVTGAAKSSDKEKIDQMTQQMVSALKEQDIPALMAHLSEQFASDRFGNKTAIQNMLEMGKSMGLLANIDLDLREAKFDIKKDRVTVSPVYLRGGFGELTLHFKGVKEKGNWKITCFEGEGGDF